MEDLGFRGKTGRELGHLWRPHTAAIGKGFYERTLKCPRCKTLRHETMSMRGAVLSRRMEYPEGYLTKDMGRIVGSARDTLRLESMTRSLGNQKLRRVAPPPRPPRPGWSQPPVDREIRRSMSRRLTEADILARINVGRPGECWPYKADAPGDRTKSGHIRVSWRGRKVYAHRLIWAFKYGPIPPGRIIVHACDRPNCQAWRHLRLSDRHTNVAERDARGRRTPFLPRGTASPFSKLGAEEVRQIRAAYAIGVSVSTLVEEFGLGKTQTYALLRRDTYADVPFEEPPAYEDAA